jgi:hypothetical protein
VPGTTALINKFEGLAKELTELRGIVFNEYIEEGEKGKYTCVFTAKEEHGDKRGVIEGLRGEGYKGQNIKCFQRLSGEGPNSNKRLKEIFSNKEQSVSGGQASTNTVYVDKVSAGDVEAGDDSERREVLEERLAHVRAQEPEPK